MPELEIENVAMSFGVRVLFTGVSVTVPEGECLVVTGANGSGKSTLLKIIAGLVRPDRGSVRFGGCPLSAERQRVGYAASDMNLYGELTGTENLAFFRKLREAEGPVRNDEILESVGLSPERGRQMVATYSSGMRQRLKLAVSLLGDPAILIWDEPTGALDARGIGIVEESIARHRNRGGIAVIATNDDGEAGRWGDQQLAIGV